MGHSYSPAPTRDSSSDVEENLIPKEEMYPERREHKRSWCLHLLVGAVALLSVMLNIVLIATDDARWLKFGTFENGFATDLEPAKLAIEAVRVPFYGELRRHENGTLYRDNPGPRYFGRPDAEIDANWEHLVYASGIDLGEDEITTAGLKDATWEEPQGGLWRTGLDVFHQLHCLNMIRKSLYPHYYGQKHDMNIDDPPRLRNMHRDHCFDYIRQALMCNADATPVRLQWDYESHFLIPKFDQLHTCRNFELLHSWSRARALEKTHAESVRLIEAMRQSGDL